MKYLVSFFSLIFFSPAAFGQLPIECVTVTGAKAILSPSQHSMEFIGSDEEPVHGGANILGVTEKFIQIGQGIWLQTYNLDKPFYVELEKPNDGSSRKLTLFRRNGSPMIVYPRCN